MKRRSIPLTINLTIAVVFLFFHLAAFAASAAESWQALWEKTVAAAKQEGRVTIYGGEEITHPDIIAEFNKSYPEIKVVTVSGHSEVIQRIIAERRAEKYFVDLFAYGPNAARTAYLAKYLDPLPPALILPEVIDTSKWYGGKHHYADPEGKYIFIYEGTPSSPSLAYNTKEVEPTKITSLWDILDSKWMGKIGLFRYGQGGAIPTPFLMFYYTSELGPEFLTKLFTDTKLQISANRRQATDWLAEGRYVLCIMCRDVEKAQKQGLPVAAFGPNDLKEGGVLGGGNSSVISLLNRGPQPNAAKVFLNWYLSRQGQATWQRMMNQKVVEASNSMRIDIAKDDVLPEAQRIDGRKYPFVGFLDPRPVQKFYNNLISKAETAR
jgi:iron(III) transport system substrate-binding protein